MSEASARVRLAAAGLSDAGVRRSANEDAFLAVEPAFLVADGMGGHEQGARASAAVVSAFESALCDGEPVDLPRVAVALEEASQSVQAVAATTQRGAGSTLSGVVLVQHEGHPHWLILNVGDSRAYRLVDGFLERLTIDHSLVQERIDAGELREEDRAEADDRNVITRAIGAHDARADSWLMPLTTGERLLLCSDGLHGELTDDQLREILISAGRPASTAAALIAAANRAGGRDNVTAVVVDVLDAGAQLPPGLAVDEVHDVGDTVPV